MTTPVLDIEAVETNFKVVSSRLDALTTAFYDDLLSGHPELRPLFTKVDFVSQRKKLAAMLTLIVTNLHRMDILGSALRTLGARHAAYGATDESYTWVADALIRSLRVVSGDAWDERAEQAWAGAIGIVNDEMRAGQAATATGEAPGGDFELLMEIASHPALSFRRDSLFAAYVDKKKADHEMSLARTVQQELVRLEIPPVPGYRFTATYEPAAQVGGDYFEWFKADDDHISFALGDVTGKGIPAALIMCRLSGAARALLAAEPDIGTAAGALNRHMCAGMPGGRFVTLALLRLDLATHRYTMVNAGHMPPIVRRADGAVAYLDNAANIPVGIDPADEYKTVSGQLAPGDALVLYTDGVNEAAGLDGALYGMDRLLDCVRGVTDPEMIRSAILEDVRGFCAGRPASDDLTMLTIRREA